MTPRAALDGLLTRVLMLGSRASRPPPGALVLEAGDDVRRALSRLTAADASDVRDEDVRRWVEP